MSFFSEYRQVTELLQQQLPIVFYSESRHYYAYFERLINDLLAKGETDIYYITSDATDPILNDPPARLKPLYVKWMLGFLFSRVRANVMIMTMPDLGNYLFKRSPAVNCYVYMFHAAVSTHQQYRPKAFDNYDCILCTGNYQEAEIRKGEQLYGLPQKELVGYGYPLFDEIAKRRGERSRNNATRPTILVAPSWYQGCIFDTCIEELLEQLAELPYNIVLRSHPEYMKRKKREFRKIQQFIKKSDQFALDTAPSVTTSILNADILITDRSGIALEFAFGTGRPVLFIDTPPKEVNPRWTDLQLPPLENSIRDKIGIVLSTGQLNQLPAALKDLEAAAVGFEGRMNVLGKQYFYNYRGNYDGGVTYVLEKIKTL